MRKLEKKKELKAIREQKRLRNLLAWWNEVCCAFAGFAHAQPRESWTSMDGGVVRAGDRVIVSNPALSTIYFIMPWSGVLVHYHIAGRVLYLHDPLVRVSSPRITVTEVGARALQGILLGHLALTRSFVTEIAMSPRRQPRIFWGQFVRVWFTESEGGVLTPHFGRCTVKITEEEAREYDEFPEEITPESLATADFPWTPIPPLQPSWKELCITKL